MRDSQDKHTLTKRWRERVRQTELRAFKKMEDVVEHRVGPYMAPYLFVGLRQVSVWTSAGFEE